MIKHIKVISKIVNSMEKVFPMTEPVSVENTSIILKNEPLDFQLCYKHAEPGTIKCANIEVVGDLSQYVTMYNVGYVPVTNLPIPSSDDYYIKKEIGLYPDVLNPFEKSGVVLPYNQWRSVWVNVKGEKNLPVGKHTLKFILKDDSHNKLDEICYKVEVIDCELEETNLKLTNWIHYDCISEKHNVKLFSPQFYNIFNKYLETYVDCGFNMLYTPLFTPPLDTKVGGERKTAQLVKVSICEDKYIFDFSDLEKFIKFALSKNIKYIEFSHLFTQWGGKFCPKIIVNDNNVEKTMFGWNTASDSDEYKEFLSQFLPELCKFIKKLNIEDICYFHITDEPHADQLSYYEKCSLMVKKHIGNMKIMDAMSDYSFYEKKLVDIPVAEISSYDKFKDKKPEEIFIYNCCYPVNKYYSNRHIMMPSQRARILGFQMYDLNCQGYLHWGFNFYNSQFSLYSVNPYIDTCAGDSFPAGDSFIVYPSEEHGVLKSIRSEVIRDGFNDYKSLLTLEKFIGRKKVCDFLHQEGIADLDQYPRSALIHQNIRQKINKKIKHLLKDN